MAKKKSSKASAKKRVVKKVVRKKAASKKTSARKKKSRPGAKRARRADTPTRISEFANSIAKLAAKGEDPFLDIPTRALSNVSFSKDSGLIEMGDAKQRRSFFNLGQAKKFMQTTLVAAGCSELLRQEKTTSIRDLFYHCKHTIEGTRGVGVVRRAQGGAGWSNDHR